MYPIKKQGLVILLSIKFLNGGKYWVIQNYCG
jgi:hypothetical protein